MPRGGRVPFAQSRVKKRVFRVRAKDTGKRGEDGEEKTGMVGTGRGTYSPHMLRNCLTLCVTGAKRSEKTLEYPYIRYIYVHRN